MNKEKFKGIIIGLVVSMLFSTSVAVMANTQTITRQITYGVGVIFNGQSMYFSADMRPFIMDGRTFLPLRAIADIMELPVDFDAATNTVILGNRFEGQRQPLNHAAPFFDRSHQNPSGNNPAVWVIDSVSMSGVSFNNALAFRRFGGANNVGRGTNFSLHNLNRQYRILSGYIGRVDGSGMIDVTVRFFGDGTLLQSYNLRATNMPIPFSIFVEDVAQLRIEVEFPLFGSNALPIYAIVAYLETAPAQPTVQQPTPIPPPTPAPIQTPVPIAPIYSLSTDLYIQRMSIGTRGDFQLLLGTSFITHTGAPTFTIVDNPTGGNAIQVSNRRNDWYGIDIVRESISWNLGTSEYVIRVSGRSATAGVEVRIGGVDEPWGVLASTITDSGGNFILETTISSSILSAHEGGAGFARGFRIQTQDTANFTVNEIIITRN